MTTSAKSTKPKATRAKPKAAPVAPEKKKLDPPTTQRFPIIGIGASAGGLEALEQFLGNVPQGCGMAFVVVQHLDPKRKGMMPELLQRSTSMAVVQAGNRMKIKPNCVYVIPPNHDLSILHDTLFLLEQAAPRGLHLPIDFFFKALADDRREDAVCVVLSGMGADGTLGLQAIKAFGGLVAAQDPTSAKFDSMPRHAIETELVDIVASAAELPAHLIKALAHFSHVNTSANNTVETSAQKSAFEKICLLLRSRTGNDFSLYKKSTIYRRIERRMGMHKIDRIAHYVLYLRQNPNELDLLFKELLIGVTSFFRDPAAWEYLQAHGFPLQAHPAASGRILRAWVAGCSTGEEAYTLAMAFCEVQDKLRPDHRPGLQIFATDLSADAIVIARRGHYPASIAADVSAERLKRFFVVDGDGYRVGKLIREMVVFAPQNVLSDPPFTNLDLITCRNLLIYLSPELQKKLIPLFHYSLKPNGILMLGSAESIGNFTELFSPLDSVSRIFRRSSINSTQRLELEFPTRYLARKAEQPMEPEVIAISSNLQALADQWVLRQVGPAAVLVNPAGDVLYTSGRSGKYLEPPAGKANWNIHAMAREGLRNELALALPKALRSGERVTYHQLRIGTNGGSQIVDLVVQPLLEPAALRGMAMVLFTDVSSATLPPVVIGSKTDGKKSTHSARVVELEQALQHAQQEVLALRVEMQAAQEDLRSSTEEMQSTNEELQSTNEELTTSKEEMQSLNEELQTVNIELQSKVDELSSTSNDMRNLLNSTDMATIFLDGNMKIRRFTTQATRLFKLLAGDVGRPLSDIASDLPYPALPGDAEEVLRTLAFSDREIATGDGRWFQVKIMPYRTMENVIDGVVVTFNDISRAKGLEAQLRVDVSNAKS